MNSYSEKDNFIDTIASFAQAEYKNRDRWVLPSVCIAQAALESGWNLNAKTLFGIKGNGNTLKTTEYINGMYVTTTANFKAYPSIAAAVHGYYDLITTSSRYSGAVNNSNYQSTIKKIAAGGYATDPDYANKIISIINSNGLTKYDNRVNLKSYDDIADEVIAGKWGNGDDRKTNLENAGYDYKTIQALVNTKLGVATKKYTITQAAKEIIAGKHGNGAARKAWVESVGLDYTKVQAKVNALMKASK